MEKMRKDFLGILSLLKLFATLPLPLCRRPVCERCLCVQNGAASFALQMQGSSHPQAVNQSIILDIRSFSNPK